MSGLLIGLVLSVAVAAPAAAAPKRVLLQTKVTQQVTISKASLLSHTALIVANAEEAFPR
jgi:hypothetical protein